MKRSHIDILLNSCTRMLALEEVCAPKRLSSRQWNVCESDVCPFWPGPAAPLTCVHSALWSNSQSYFTLLANQARVTEVVGSQISKTVEPL